jgi:hypothetical protein
LFFNLQLYNNLDSCKEYSLRTWIKFFFHSAIYNRKCANLSFKNSTPPQLTSAQWSLFRLWQLKKEEIEGVLLTPLRILQMRGAFIAAFTIEKRWMKIKKSLFRNSPLIPNFFIAHLSSLVRCKTKGAVRAVCALLRIWSLSA